MAKTKKAPDTRTYVFDELDEAKRSAVDYGNSDPVNVKTGKQPKYKVVKVDGGADETSRYVVAKSKNAALLKVVEKESMLTASNIRTPMILPPGEYVEVLSADQFDDLLTAIATRKAA